MPGLAVYAYHPALFFVGCRVCMPFLFRWSCYEGAAVECFLLQLFHDFWGSELTRSDAL